MKRQINLIELGKASVETKGAGILVADDFGRQDKPGLNLA